MRHLPALLALMLAAGCATPQEPARMTGSQTLEGTTWIAQNIGGRAVAEGSRADITFSTDGRVYGAASCNRFTGSWTRAPGGAAIAFAPMAVTRMACPPPLMEQEDRYLAALQGTQPVRLGAGTLVLGEGAGALTFRAGAPQQ